jgi:putative transposase
MVDTELPQGIEASENERTQVLERFYVIRPFLEDGVPLAQIAKERAIPRRTLTRWVKQYRETGLDGLIRQGRADKGERRNTPPDLKSLIEGLALQKPRRSAAATHRQVTRVATEQGWPVPSYSQVYAIIDALDPGLVVLAHEGSKAYREQFDLLYRFEAEAPNHLWQADHTFLPVFLLNERGKPDRPWLSAILDDHSRTIAGYFLGFQAPTALQTAQRKTLRETLTDRQQVVERYLAVHRPPEMRSPGLEPLTPPLPRLKRYINE